MIIAPAILLITLSCFKRNCPIAVADAPSAINTIENPRMKNTVRSKIWLRSLFFSDSFFITSSETPEINEIYPGTIGNTHGEINERNPNSKAVRIFTLEVSTE